ncbi:MAG: GNAT family N-acetyltransferase [Promethearchaeota archaeon]
MLKGERIILGPIKREYIDSFLKWLNDPEIMHYISRYIPLTRMKEEDWIENLKNRDDTILFAISIFDENGKEKHIGNCGLHDIDWKNRSCEVGIMIGEKEYHGKGYGTEAMVQLVKYGFEEVNLNRIYLRVFDFNERAINSYIKVGFIKEGRLRQAQFKNGKYHDIFLMSILYEDWLNGNR